MRVSDEIGLYKKEHNLTILQSTRYDKIIDRGVELGAKLGMSEAFMRAYMEAVHEESIRRQMEIINK
jgi:chorismate mutase